MIARNLRHLRVFLAVAALRSPTLAADRCGLSQPAVTQALARLEQAAGGALFDRTRQGFALTARGEVLAGRVARAMGRLDAALAEVAPRLAVTATHAQLQALAAMAEAQNYTLAARALGLAQPTVHRAIRDLEAAAGRALFERTSLGVVPTRAARALARAVQLALSEIAQAEADMAEIDGQAAGRIVVGALPLSRSVILPEALARFRDRRPAQRITVIDGPYDEMLAGLRRGDIDLILGALRDPLPIGDVVQEALFDDRLSVLARPGHALAGGGVVRLDRLAGYPWAVPRAGTPSRAQFDALFAGRGLAPPVSLVECGSILLMRELLGRSDLLGCISELQAAAEVERGLLVRLDIGVDWPGRPIGITHRAGWHPTAAQAALVAEIRAAAARLAA